MIKWFFTDLNKFFCFLVLYSMFFSIFFINDLFYMWVCYEVLNLFLVVYFVLNGNSGVASIYFILSSLSGILLLLCVFYIGDMNFIMEGIFMKLLIYLILFFKLGLFPFNYWIVYLCESMTWLEVCLFSTLGKFGTIYFMLILFNDINYYLVYCIAFSSFIISLYLGSIDSYKGMIASTSIIQSSFIFLMGMFDEEMMFYFSLIYSISFFVLCVFFYYLDISSFSSFSNVLFSPFLKLTYVCLITSYSGFPPFCLFILKWSIINVLIYNMTLYYLLFIVYTLSSVIIMWVYVSLFIYSLTNYVPSMKKSILNRDFEHLLLFFSIFLVFSIVCVMLVVLI
uniref:NADH-ubiquinone oxidoreductase chain 2 n=1 Tax=Habropoda radoszkowskii TaxID=597470 RepID=A0A7L8EYR8_9HYME|nr:NADH dehydrogenase subunit 2 [Habropoda radoszkowskii]QOE17516.1 NADH dehydrogenase subunit 2 [Habropoda radoszkowskii]